MFPLWETILRSVCLFFLHNMIEDTLQLWIVTSVCQLMVVNFPVCCVAYLQEILFSDFLVWVCMCILPAQAYVFSCEIMICFCLWGLTLEDQYPVLHVYCWYASSSRTFQTEHNCAITRNQEEKRKWFDKCPICFFSPSF